VSGPGTSTVDRPTHPSGRKTRVIDSQSAVSVKGLGLVVGGVRLLRDASFELKKGEIALLLGESGSGKTILMKTLCGLVGPGEPGFSYEGDITVLGHEVLAAGRQKGSPIGRVGIVLQDFGLLDEMSVEGNIDFASSHARSGRAARGEDAREKLLTEFDLPRHVPVSRLSGGQKQRLAIARALAYDPEILLYDEPTSGLDPSRKAQVAGRIQRTNREHGTTTIVVTHDHAALLSIADRVFVIDRATESLREVDREEVGADLTAPAGGAGVPPATTSGPGPLSRLLAATGGVTQASLLLLASLVPRWRSVRHGLYYLLYYLRLVVLGSSIVYMGCAGAIIGFVATYFVIEFLPHRTFTEPLLLDEVLTALGYALFRVMVPVLGAVLLAARCGAAVAADIGNRSASGQLDVLRSLGAPPRRYLLTGVTHAFLVGGPLLVLLAFGVARMVSLGVFLYLFPEHSAQFWDRVFHRLIRSPGASFPFYDGMHWVLLKTAVASVGVGAISYFLGERSKVSGREVSGAVTSAVIWTTLWALLVQAAFAFWEFAKP